VKAEVKEETTPDENPRNKISSFFNRFKDLISSNMGSLMDDNEIK
jgi:hypothetical protein